MSAHASSTHARPQSRSSSTSTPTRRITLMHGIYFLLFALLLVRLVTLQIMDHGHYNRLSLLQAKRDITTTALRAGVYDRYGHTLAISQPTAMVLADDLQIHSPHTEAIAMSGFIHIPVGKLTHLLSKHSGYVVLSSTLDLADGRAITAQNFPGVVVESSSTRSYPNGTLAQSLLGRTNAAGVGSTGLEYQNQSLLAGQSGLSRAYLSGSGVNLPSTYTTVIKKAVPGVGLELTVDNSLQFVTEHVLANQLHAVGGITGQAIVLDVKTGEVLADASLVNTKTNPGVLGPIPAWGQSVGVPGIEQTINNLPFSQAYEPGSVFKAVTFSAALQAGVITPSTKFTVPNSVVVGGRYFHDAESHGLERLSATQVLALSSNLGTYEVGRTVGENKILAQVQRMGFGQLTSINYPGETAGLLVNAATWYGSDAVALPIGQVDAVPAIQVLDAYNSIANNGTFVEPKLVRGYVYANGKLQATPPSVSRPALSYSVARTMNKMLQQVVLAGTGTNAIIPGYAVAGKTGTATIPKPGADRLLVGEYNASFVGFAPANNPTLSMIVVIERPQTSIFGGTVAAPVFQQVMSYALHHYNIASNGTMTKPLKGAAAFASDVT